MPERCRPFCGLCDLAFENGQNRVIFRSMAGRYSSTFCFGVFGNVYVVVHGSKSPEDVEWRAYVDDMERKASAVKGVLVYTVGAGPNPGQRKYVADMWSRRGQMLPLALLTPSSFVRGVVTALNWMLPKPIRTFDVHQVDEALGFLQLSDAEKSSALAALEDFRGQLGLPLRAAG